MKLNQLLVIFLVILYAMLGLPNFVLSLDLSTAVVMGYEGKGPLEFLNPEDVVSTSDGRIIIADQKNNRIQILTKTGEFIRFIPTVNQGEDNNTSKSPTEEQLEELKVIRKLLKHPTGLALDKDNLLYVACNNSHQIGIFNIETGKLVNSIGKWGKKQGQLTTPMDIDISEAGRLVVSEWRNKRVQVMTSSGECIKELLYQKETKNGRYLHVAPRGVCWVDEDTVLVAYPLFNQVVCWKVSSGSVLWRYGIQGNGRGMLNNPSYITKGLDGHFLISDTKNHRVVEISAEGKFVVNYRMGKGSAPGRLLNPRGIALLQDNSLAICDQGNNRLQLFKPGQVTITLLEIKDLAIQEKWKEAMPKIDKVLYLQPNNRQARDLMVNALYYFGDEAYKKHDYMKAEECYRKVLRYRPNDLNIPQKLDEIFWASNQGLITNVIFGIIALIVSLITIWLLKVVIYRFILRK